LVKYLPKAIYAQTRKNLQKDSDIFGTHIIPFVDRSSLIHA